MTDFDLAKYFTPKKELVAGKPEAILAYGKYGSGKTSFGLSASLVPELAPVLVLDLEGSTTGVASNFPTERLEVVNVSKIADGDPLKGFAFMDQTVNALLEDARGFKTVMIDPLSTWNEWCLRHFDEESRNSGRYSNYDQWTKTGDYLTGTGGMIQRLKNAPFLFYGTLHTKDSDDGSAAALDFAWPGANAKSKLGQYPDMVLALEMRVDKGKGTQSIRATTVGNAASNAKNRYKLPITIDDVSIPVLWDLISKTDKK